MKRKQITIKDIAKKADVSVATVSYVVNNTRFVSPEKAERVKCAIKELNYFPNAAARGLRVKESKIIGLTVTDITNPFYPDLAKACEDMAQTMGYTLTIINTNDQAEKTTIAASRLREGKIDGLIITTALEQDRSVIQALIEEGQPIVLAHRSLENIQADTVVFDNFKGSLKATRHLINLGHQKICFMGGVLESSVGSARVNAFLQGMKENGLSVREEWILPGGPSYSESYKRTFQLMKLPNESKPTAVINIADIGAIGVMDAAIDLGLNIPDDLAVLGFDDIFVSASRKVQLTSMKVPGYELGRMSTELLLERIAKAEMSEYRNIILPVELMIRGTCGGRKKMTEKKCIQ